MNLIEIPKVTLFVATGYTQFPIQVLPHIQYQPFVQVHIRRDWFEEHLEPLIEDFHNDILSPNFERICVELNIYPSFFNSDDYLSGWAKKYHSIQVPAVYLHPIPGRHYSS